MYKELSSNEKYDYVDQIDLILCMQGGTGGWAEAFKQTCKKLSMLWLWDYYRSLEWYDSDLFDGEIADGIIEKFFRNENHHCNSYYKYLIEKNEINEK